MDPVEGRIYISRDVTFDERIFPFASLHPNAGARLKAEMQILPDILLNSSTNIGDAALLDRTMSSPVPSNTTPHVAGAPMLTGSQLEQDSASSAPNNALYRMGWPEGGSTPIEIDPPAHDSDGSGGSSSGSASLSSGGGSL